MAHQLISPLQLHTWSRELQKDFIAQTVWGKFSNINKENAKAPKDKEKKVPKTCIHYISTEFKDNAFDTTIPLLKSLVDPGVGGRQTAKGTGEKPQVRYAKVFWNLIRKVINSDREGVDIKSQEYLKIAKQHYKLLGDWFAQDEDYAFQMAICEGADIYLVDPKFWTDYELQNTPPVSRLTHPNICFPGMTRSNMPALPAGFDNKAYTNNVVSSLAGMDASDSFSFNALDQLMEYARGHIIPMSEGDVQYVVLLSHVQAAQLRKDPDFLATNMSAAERGDSNRALSGVIGTWQGFKFIEDLRSPIFSLDDNEFKYVTYENGTTVDRFSGIASLSRKAKAAQGTAQGTCEVARVMGAGAIGVPMVNGSSLSFEEEPTDFKAFGEICGKKYTGHCRLDFKDGKNTIIENKSSALFLTATPSTYIS